MKNIKTDEMKASEYLIFDSIRKLLGCFETDTTALKIKLNEAIVAIDVEAQKQKAILADYYSTIERIEAGKLR